MVGFLFYAAGPFATESHRRHLVGVRSVPLLKSQTITLFLTEEKGKQDFPHKKNWIPLVVASCIMNSGQILVRATPFVSIYKSCAYI